MLQAVIEATALEFGANTEQLLVMKSSFSIEKNNLSGDVYLMFDPKATKEIISALHAKFN
jgi:chemotaxis protein CheY-P-specific phosphatase CheC